VIQTVTGAATTEGLEEATCERRAECDICRAVWVGRTDTADAVEPRAGFDRHDEFLAVIAEMNDADWRRPPRAALETGAVQVVQPIPAAGVPEVAREAAEQFGIEAGIAVPLVHRERVEGVLLVLRPPGRRPWRAAPNLGGPASGTALRSLPRGCTRLRSWAERTAGSSDAPRPDDQR